MIIAKQNHQGVTTPKEIMIQPKTSFNKVF